jgi:hypothetical protein
MKAFAIILSVLCFCYTDAKANPIMKFELDVYKFGVSQNEDCSDMKVIIDHGSVPRRVDLVNNPSFGSGYIEPGTYRCVALEISRTMHVTPDTPPAGVGTCMHGQSSPIYIGMDRNDYEALSTADKQIALYNMGTYLLGTPVSKTSDGGDSGFIFPYGLNYEASVNGLASPGAISSSRMAMYLTTDQNAGNVEECFYIPTYALSTANRNSGTRCGVKIAQPLVINGNESASFITRIISPATAIDNNEVGGCNVTGIEFDFIQ